MTKVTIYAVDKDGEGMVENIFEGDVHELPSFKIRTHWFNPDAKVKLSFDITD